MPFVLKKKLKCQYLNQVVIETVRKQYLQRLFQSLML